VKLPSGELTDRRTTPDQYSRTRQTDRRRAFLTSDSANPGNCIFHKRKLKFPATISFPDIEQYRCVFQVSIRVFQRDASLQLEKKIEIVNEKCNSNDPSSREFSRKVQFSGGSSSRKMRGMRPAIWQQVALRNYEREQVGCSLSRCTISPNFPRRN
jgi:hypothetical protein